MKTKKRITVSMSEETARVVYTLVEVALALDTTQGEWLAKRIELTRARKNKLVELSDELAFQITTEGV